MLGRAALGFGVHGWPPETVAEIIVVTLINQWITHAVTWRGLSCTMAPR